MQILVVCYMRTFWNENGSLARVARSDTQRTASRRQASGASKTFVVNGVRGIYLLAVSRARVAG